VSGILKPNGVWLQAELTSEEGEEVGEIRLRYLQAEEGGTACHTMISNFKGTVRKEWGRDIIARRPDTGGSPYGNIADSRRQEAKRLLPEKTVDSCATMRDDERIGLRTGELWLVVAGNNETDEGQLESEEDGLLEAFGMRASPRRDMPEERCGLAADMLRADSPAEKRASPRRDRPEERCGLAADMPRADSPAKKPSETCELTIHISSWVQETFSVPRGTSVYAIKERLACIDPTGEATPDCIQLKLFGPNSAKLSDDMIITAASEFVLCT